MKKIVLLLSLTVLLLTTSVFAQTKDYIVPGTAFEPGANIATFHSVGIYTRADSDSTYGHFFAPVYLPDGAKIVKITAFFRDEGAGNIDITLDEHNLYTDSTTTRFSLITSGSTSGVRNQSDTTGWCRINNSGYQYSITAYFDSSSLGISYRIYGVKIVYNE